MDKDKIYSIEVHEGSARTNAAYRFRSLFNSAKGCWCDSKKIAIKEGEQHQSIIFSLFARSSYDSTRIKVTRELNEMIEKRNITTENLIKILSVLKP